MAGLNEFIKKHPLYNFLYGMVFGVFLNVISDVIGEKLGLQSALVLLILLVTAIILIMVFHSQFEKIKRGKFPVASFEPIKKKYGGLIVSISKSDKSKDEIINEINSVKDLNYVEGLKKLYEIRGIGQTFRAIIHHIKKLDVCWVLYTQQSENEKEVVKYFIKKFGKGQVKLREIFVEKPTEIKSIHKKIDEIFLKGIDDFNLQTIDVIADITGGSTTMSSAMIIACLPSDRHVEYVDQDTNKLIEIEQPLF